MCSCCTWTSTCSCFYVPKQRTFPEAPNYLSVIAREGTLGIPSVATTARRVEKENIKIQRSRRFTCLSTEVLQTACLLQKVPILGKKELPACSALWWLSALLRGK